MQGHPAEYRLDVRYEKVEVALSDGEVASLRRPTCAAAELGYGPLAEGGRCCRRGWPPQLIGLGLLEAVPAAEILSREDADDADGDGISGRAQIIWSFGQSGRCLLRRDSTLNGYEADASLFGDILRGAIVAPDRAAPAGGRDARALPKSRSVEAWRAWRRVWRRVRGGRA